MNANGKTKITAIICAYNEEKTIEEIVCKATDYFFDEVIVVNDGSTDKTDAVLKNLLNYCSFKYIVLVENMGKGHAMASGIELSCGDVIVFFDSDLSNLKEEHFEKLIVPVLNKEVDMVLGQPSETTVDFRKNPLKSLSGQRSLLRKDILPIVDKMKETRYGVETLINLYYRAEGKNVKYVLLKGLAHPNKFEKTSPSKAMTEFIKAGHQIVTTALKNFSYVSRIANSTKKNND